MNKMKKPRSRMAKAKKATITVENILKIIMLLILFAALAYGIYNLLKLILKF
jgi:hypothetical protein